MSAALVGHLLCTCSWAYSAGSSALWWAASLPPTCRESLAHAALTCSGAVPRYFTPGFGPLALGWGWLLLGVLLGLLCRRSLQALQALAGHPDPSWNWEAYVPKKPPPLTSAILGRRRRRGPCRGRSRLRSTAAAVLARLLGRGGHGERGTFPARQCETAHRSALSARVHAWSGFRVGEAFGHVRAPEHLRLPHVGLGPVQPGSRDPSPMSDERAMRPPRRQPRRTHARRRGSTPLSRRPAAWGACKPATSRAYRVRRAVTWPGLTLGFARYARHS